MPLCAENIARDCTLNIEPGKKLCFPCMREKKRQNAKRYYGLSPFRREKIVEYIINHYHIDRTTGQIAVHFGVTPAAISNQVKNLRQEGFEFPPKPTAIQMTLNKLKQK